VSTTTKPNQPRYVAIKPGEQVVLLTYMVGLVPDGDEDNMYDPFPVHLRKRPEDIETVNVSDPDEELRQEILKRADKLERREHPTAAEREFSLGKVRLVRQKLDVAR
jgi:hypothetical protein